MQISRSSSEIPSLLDSQSFKDEKTGAMHILDDIHGYIEIPNRIKKIMDTPHFQRLRDLKQLGTAYYVFPGASHNRFEHCLGTMHLAGKLIDHLSLKQPELNISNQEKFVTRAAGLLHDLGHGPFSHLFDNEFIPTSLYTTAIREWEKNGSDASTKPVKRKFRHEDMSVKLIDSLFEENNIEITDESLQLIKAMVSPSSFPQLVQSKKRDGKGWLFQIVANDTSGIDVDKWDYMLRDSQNCRMGISFDYERLLEHCRVIDGHLCFQEKTNYTLYTLFQTRYELFKRVYSHKACKAIAYMVCDAFQYANDVMQITDKINDPMQYLELSDSLISAIEYYPIHTLSRVTPNEKRIYENMVKAKDIIRRIRNRDLYKCCGYLLLSPETVQQTLYRLESLSQVSTPDMTPPRQKPVFDKKSTQKTVKINYGDAEIKIKDFLYDWITNNYSGDEIENFSRNDILVQLMSLHYGMEACHPIEKVNLYSTADANHRIPVSVQQISMITGTQYREIIFRVFTKQPKLKAIVSRAYTEFTKIMDLVAQHSMSQYSISISPKVAKSKTSCSNNQDSRRGNHVTSAKSDTSNQSSSVIDLDHKSNIENMDVDNTTASEYSSSLLQTPPRIKSQCQSLSDPMHILDDIHGYIEIPDQIREIMDTPHFQRLRDLKQLGAMYYIFPGASHNRFEHSLGTMHLAGQLVRFLKQKQPELDITDNHIFIAQAAGLLHDIGHGPFSHVFDNEFVPLALYKADINEWEKNGSKPADKPEKRTFRHEDMSVQLIDSLFKENNIEITDESLELVKAMVSPSSFPQLVQKYKAEKKDWLFQIVANDTSGIDVDKWDYMLRDSQNCRLGITFFYERLLRHCRVINGQICFHEKTNFSLYTLFRTRYELFRRVYSHKAGKAIEYMICDAFVLSNDILKITDKITNPKDYLQLTDSLIHRIEYYPIDLLPQSTPEEIRNRENMIAAQSIIDRIRKRKLYKCCGYVLMKSETVASMLEQIKEMPTGDDRYSTPPPHSNVSRMRGDDDDNTDKPPIKINYRNAEIEIREYLFDWMKCNESRIENKNDMLVQLMSLSYGMEDYHPIEKVNLYSTDNPTKSNNVSIDQISMVSGKQYREIVFRVYVKNLKDKCNVVKAVSAFSHKFFGECHESTVLSPCTERYRSKIIPSIALGKGIKPVKRSLSQSTETDTNVGSQESVTGSADVPTPQFINKKLRK